MRTFQDRNGQNWDLQVDYPALKRVKGVLGIDLLGPKGSEEVEKLRTSDLVLVDVLYVLCRKQADARSMGDEDFARCLTPDIVESVRDTLIDGVIDFFRPGQRELARKAFRQLRQVEHKASEVVAGVIDSDEFDRRIDEALKASITGAFQPNSPASSASP